MAFRIRLLPQDRSFAAEPNESLLDAALRSGVTVPYNCNNGSCGACRARLLAGSVEPTRVHDFRLDAIERQQGALLLCSTRAASDLTLVLPEGDAGREFQQIDARIDRLSRPAPDCLILQLRTPRTRTLRFRAGETVCLTLAEGERRELPVASCPCNGMTLEFHVAVTGEDGFGERLATARSGQTVRIEGPYLRCTLDEASRRPLLFVAEGVLFAAAKSLIEHAIALELPQPMHLLWLSSGPSHYLDNYCRSLVDALDDFVYMPLDATLWEPKAAELPSLVAGVRDCDLYLITRPALALRLAEAFADAGLPEERIFLWSDP